MRRELVLDRLLVAAACALGLAVASAAGFAEATPALADGPTGSDPAVNFAVTSLPASCSQPTSAACIDASVGYLDRARARLGQPPYALPAGFDALTPAEQGFVLADLDRVLYKLTPIPGLIAGLDRDAATGVREDADPDPSSPDFTNWTSNWAGGFLNMPLAYEAWMYDDGPGSGNIDCTASDRSGCWGHRHDVLSDFGAPGGSLGMGAAAGIDPGGLTGYAMLLGAGGPSWKPTYTYTWAAALAAGANGGDAGPTPAADHLPPIT